MSVGDQVKSWKRKCSFLSFLGSLFSSSVGTVSLWNCWLLYLKRKKCGGSGTNDGLCGWRYVFINEIILMLFFCAALWGSHRSAVSFVGTTLIYPPSLSLSFPLSFSLSLPLCPVFLSLAPISLCPSPTFALFLLYSSKSLSSVPARPVSDRRAPWVKLDFHLSNFTHLSASLHSFYIIIARHEIFSQRCINHLHKVWVTSKRWSSHHLRHSTLHTY